MVALRTANVTCIPQNLPAGLGDVAVPGLLACLALRYDASRATNMRARAAAAAQAITGSLAGMQVPRMHVLPYLRLEKPTARMQMPPGLQVAS